MTRREFAIAAGAATLAGVSLSARTKAADDAKKTLRFIAQSDLRVLDPIWTTAYITRNHGYMVYDTLFATDAEFAPHPQMVGSGPFKFVKDEFQPGHQVVYVKNTDYVPRNEPPSWASGGKVVKIDRVEWLYIPDAMTKVAALNGGEADWWENPPLDLVPVLAANPDITNALADPLPSPIMVKFNHLLPPFDNVKMRQAVLAVTSQADFLTALAGERRHS